MILEAIHHIQETALPERIKCGDRDFLIGPGHKVTEIGQPKLLPPLSDVATLDGFVDAAKSLLGTPPSTLNGPAISVSCNEEWRIGLSEIEVETRTLRIAACFVGRDAAKFALSGLNQATSIEAIIRIQTHFVGNEDRERLLDVLGTIIDSSEVRTTDNGVSQEVSGRQGISVGWTGVKNPYLLRPFCTYAEVAQPIVAYILRLEKGNGVRVSLIPVQDASWRAATVRRIVDYLRVALPGYEDIIYG